MKTQAKRTFAFFVRHLLQFRWMFLGMVVMSVSAVLIEVIIPLYYKEIFDLFVDSDVKTIEMMTHISSLILVLGVLLMLNFVCWILAEAGFNRVIVGGMKNITNEIFAYIIGHSYRFFSNIFSGSLVRKANRLITAYDNFVGRVYWSCLPITVRILSVMVVVFYYSPLLAVIILIWFFLYLGLNLVLLKKKYPLDLDSNRADSTLSGQFSDVVGNAVNVQLFTAQEYEKESYHMQSSIWYQRSIRSWNYGTKMNALQLFLMVVLELVVLVITVRLWYAGTVSAGFLMLIHAYLINIFANIWDLRRAIQDIFQAFADAEQTIEILNTPHEVKDLPEAKDLRVKKAALEFKNVTFGYSEEKPVLKNFNLSVRPGEKIALVGHSGEGKSTVTKLLMRLFDVQKGQIHYDGQNIAGVTLESLRENISLVPQDPILFHRSILENIRYGRRNATKSQVIAAAKLANCHEFISKLKKKYDTFVGERGVKLSGGERQRIAVARAILENAPIVILDEATSSLDSYSEKLIHQALRRLLKGKTAIMIAHRLSTIMEADRILVIKNGKIVEQGNHKSLLRRKKGIYRRLWEIQAGGFIGE